MRTLILIVIYSFTIYNSSFSQPSGWLHLNENTKLQSLIMPGINSISFSHDGKNFYTFNSPNKVYIWRTESGVLLDSIILEQTPTKLFFSKDGFTFSYYTYDDSDPNYWECKTPIYIYNISKKSIISSCTMDLINEMKFKSPSIGFVDDRFSINILDHDLISNIITISCTFQLLEPDDWTYYWYGIGLNGEFDVLQDTLVFNKTLSSGIYNEILKTSDKYYFTNYTWDYSEATRGGHLQKSRHKYFYTSIKNDLNQNSLNILSSSFDEGHSQYGFDPPKDWRNGKDVAFSKLFLSDSLNLLLVKYGEIYYYINTETNAVIDSMFIRKPFTHEEVTSKFDYLISLDSNKLLYYDIQSKALIDSFEISHEITNFTITPNSNKIIAYNTDGNIFLIYDTLFTSFNQTINDNEQKLSVFPNPSQGNIHLEWDDSRINAERIIIYNLLGEAIYRSSNDNFTSGYFDIDLSRFYKGSYYVIVTGKKANIFANFFVTEF